MELTKGHFVVAFLGDLRTPSGSQVNRGKADRHVVWQEPMSHHGTDISTLCSTPYTVWMLSQDPGAASQSQSQLMWRDRNQRILHEQSWPLPQGRTCDGSKRKDQGQEKCSVVRNTGCSSNSVPRSTWQLTIVCKVPRDLMPLDSTGTCTHVYISVCACAHTHMYIQLKTTKIKIK